MNAIQNMDAALKWIIELGIEVVVGLGGFIAVAITLCSDKKIKKAEFVADFNFHFLTNKEFVEVETQLENCYQLCKDCEEKEAVKETLKDSKLQRWLLRSNDNKMVKRGHQKVINYLVYLESFAHLILKKHVKFKDIDDLFGYRYFIAMNNPIIQEYELFPEKEYYRGCIKVYRKWKMYRRRRKLPIPMITCDMQECLKEWDKKREKNLKIARDSEHRQKCS